MAERRDDARAPVAPPLNLNSYDHLRPYNRYGYRNPLTIRHFRLPMKPPPPTAEEKRQILAIVGIGILIIVGETIQAFGQHPH